MKFKIGDKVKIREDLSLGKCYSVHLSRSMVLNNRTTEYKTIYKNDEILDSTEKRYLATVIKPFRDEVKNITKIDKDIGRQYISIRHDDGLYIKNINLPYFKSETMYVGMKPNKVYTLEELGL